MLKYTITLFLIGLSFFGFGQQILSGKEHRGLDSLIKENVIKDYELIKSKAIQQVLAGDFFYVKMQNYISNSGSYHEYRLTEIQGRLLELNDVKRLLFVIRKDFKINSEVNALKFERMLGVLFPPFSISSITHYKKNDSWVFIRENSFDEKNGFIVKIDKKGKIISIEEKDNIQD